MFSVIARVFAVIFLVMAAFKATWAADTVSWLFLGLAAWCASGLPLDSMPARRRTDPERS